MDQEYLTPFRERRVIDVKSVELACNWKILAEGFLDWGDGELPGKDIWQKRLDRFDGLMDEDYSNLEPIQRSMEHAAHGGQVIGFQERRIWHVHAWMDKVIGADRIPGELHVPDLLADWVESVPGST